LVALAIAANPVISLAIGLVLGAVALRMIAESVPGFRSFDSSESVRPEPGQNLRKMVIGAAAGGLPGLLGIGGGAILVPAFRLSLRWPIKAAIGSSLACFAINASVSSVLKGAQGYVDLATALPAALGAFLGGNLGGALSRRFRSRFLQLLFGAVFTYVALKFVLIFFGIRI
jgi:hypothetical protein